ncbi:MAG: TetR/AcrR family transcriptional regulator [Candidatus Sedimenticola endophacoides]
MGRRSDHSREQIARMALEAARRIVREEGLGALTARRVAGAIGYSPGALYLVFNNLDGLIMQLNVGTLDELFALLRRAAESGDGGRASIRALARGYVGFSLEHARLWGAVYEHRLPAGERVPPWLQTRIERLVGLVETPLRELAPERDADQVRLAANALWSGIHGACILHLSGSLEKTLGGSPLEIADSLVDHYLRGFCGT